MTTQQPGSTPASPAGRIKTDKVQRSTIALPEAGRIKIGEKRRNDKGKEYPASLEHFRATGTFAELFHKIMGPKPDKITIVFITDDIAASCNEEYACWENGKRYGFGDGETFQVWDPALNKGKGGYATVDKTSALLKGKQWDIMLTLRFVIPELKGVLGHWVFSTKGAKTTIPSIVSSFDFIKERVGTVIGVPFELVVEKAKGYSPGEARQYSKVKLIPCFSEDYMIKVKEFLAAGKSLAEIAPLMVSEAKLLSSGADQGPAIELEAHIEKHPLDAAADNMRASGELMTAIAKENPPVQPRKDLRGAPPADEFTELFGDERPGEEDQQ